MNLNSLSRGFKALGEPTRQRIIKLLSINDLYVCELAAALDMKQPRVSQHLRILKDAGFLDEENRGTWTRYRLNREALNQFWNEFQTFLATPLKDLSEFRLEAERILSGQTNQALNKCKTGG